jgi:hypothetical protein
VQDRLQKLRRVVKDKPKKNDIFQFIFLLCCWGVRINDGAYRVVPEVVDYLGCLDRLGDGSLSICGAFPRVGVTK